MTLLSPDDVVAGRHSVMASFMLFAATGSTPTTPQCDSLSSSIVGDYTTVDMTTYKKATSTSCEEIYNLYPRNQIVGRTSAGLDPPASLVPPRFCMPARPVRISRCSVLRMGAPQSSARTCAREFLAD